VGDGISLAAQLFTKRAAKGGRGDRPPGAGFVRRGNTDMFFRRKKNRGSKKFYQGRHRKKKLFRGRVILWGNAPFSVSSDYQKKKGRRAIGGKGSVDVKNCVSSRGARGGAQMLGRIYYRLGGNGVSSNKKTIFCVERSRRGGPSLDGTRDGFPRMLGRPHLLKGDNRREKNGISSFQLLDDAFCAPQKKLCRLRLGRDEGKVRARPGKNYLGRGTAPSPL